MIKKEVEPILQIFFIVFLAMNHEKSKRETMMVFI